MASPDVSVSHNLKQHSQAEIDAALEREIETAHRFAMKYATIDPELAREAFSIHARLVARRSPEQVAKLERERGLRA